MAAIDFEDVAQAIVTRFSAANVTQPSGEDDVRLATEQLPNQIGPTPAMLVFPPIVSFSYGPSTRKATAVYPVRWYLYRVKDQPRNASLILRWMASLYAQLEGQVQLGLSSYVTHGVVSELTPGLLSYADEQFEGIETTVTVHMWEGLAPVA